MSVFLKPGRVNLQHLDILMQYMERYPRLAHSVEPPRQSRKMWEKIARTLNKVNKNVTKTAHGWKRYYSDRKHKARKKYASIRQSQQEGTTCKMTLDIIEQRLVKIMTDKDGNLLPLYVHSPELEKLKVDASPASDDDDDDDEAEDQSMVSPASADGEANKPSNQTIKQEDPISIEYEDCSIEVEEMKDISDLNRSTVEDNRIEELRRERLEFELRRQQELFEMEKMQLRERHQLEMDLLRLKKQILMKELSCSI